MPDNGNHGDERWEAQLRKGCLELAILATLWHERHYGLEILRALETGSDLTIGEGTLYPILSRLRNEGLLSAEWVEADAGHPRKYYRLTAAGRRRGQEMARVWSGFAGSLSALVLPLLDGKGKS